MLQFAVPNCITYGGIPHPENKNVCCSKACGLYCGSQDCELGPGGRPACCMGTAWSTGIITNEKTCSVAVLAPCNIGAVCG